MKKWWVLTGVAFLLVVVGLSCVVFSIFQEGNNIFLFIGLACSCVSLILMGINNKRLK